MLRYKKNPRSSKHVIQVDGKLYNAKYIGKGNYSRVYQVGDRVVYFTRGDCGKEVLAMFMHNRMMHLPDIIHHENITVRPGIMWHVFSAPFYRNVTSKDKRAFRLMKQIMFVSLRALPVIYGEKYKGVDAMQRFVDVLRPVDALPRSVINALQEIVDVASNCGSDVGFDLHKKNFGVDEYGTLIFRDPIFVRE